MEMGGLIKGVPALAHASPTLFNAGCNAPGWRFSSGIHSLMTSIFWVSLACRRSLYVLSYALGLDDCLYTDKLKWN